MEHPDAPTSFLYHISKAVGKANLAPIELFKSYVTNPEVARNCQPYLFDPNELFKLR
jgi:hypothetical protein